MRRSTAVLSAVNAPGRLVDVERARVAFGGDLASNASLVDLFGFFTREDVDAICLSVTVERLAYLDFDRKDNADAASVKTR